MKITDLQRLDQNIIKLQGRIAFLQGKGCAIGSIDNIGYFAPLNEEERTKGITKKENMAYSTLKAVMGVRSASLDWLDKMID